MSYQSYDYATVLIGDQCWFAENLRNENYENGDAIASSQSNSEWQNTVSGAVAVYDESCECDDFFGDYCDCDPNLLDADSNLEVYGRLYNWYAVDDGRGLCPSGWKVPSDGEWTVLTDHLGGEPVASGQMKSSYGWANDGNGTNSSGFSGLPGGMRNDGGNFDDAVNSGRWWSSSPDGSYPNAWSRFLSFYDESVYRNINNQRDGFSVRCIQD